MPVLLRALMFTVGQLPLPLLHALGSVLGRALWRVPNDFRRITEQQLAFCMPEIEPGERERIARASLIESAKAVFEAPAIWFGSARRRARWLDDPAARAALQAHAARGGGSIWLTPHQGAWELAGFFLAQAGPITLLYKPQKGASDAIILEGRSRAENISLVRTDARGVKALLAALKRGEAIGVLPDHDPPEGSGRFAPLFGIPAHTMDLVPKLAARSSATVSFIVTQRLPRGRGFRFHLIAADARIRDAEHGVEVLNAGVEACIRRWPEQYWWSYRRYRRRPPGATNLYS